MRLEEKLSQLNDNETTAFKGFLPLFVKTPSHLQVSWLGDRRVSFEGYEGSVALDHLADCFMKSINPENLSLQQRLDWNGLWDKVEHLYDKSDTILAKLSRLSEKILSVINLLRLLPCKRYFEAHMRIRGRGPFGNRQPLFSFSREEFKKHWPGCTPIECDSRYVVASREMVEELLIRESRTR